jgi:hypothetical protein
MNQQIEISPNVLMHQFGDEAVLLNLNSEMYYALNATGIRMWQLLSTTKTLEGALQQMLAEYDVDEQNLRSDLDEFLQMLVRFEIVQITAP